MGRECPINGVKVLLLLILHVHSSVRGCQQREHDALLKFRHSVNDPANLLSSWNGEDCCHWNGVKCNSVTGHVEILNLRNPAISDHVIEYSPLGFALGRKTPYGLRARVYSEFNSCLVELKHLRYLDLSRNDFQGSCIPEFIGAMKELRYLNLSGAAFSGVVPSWFRNFTKLQVLDLSWNYNDTEFLSYSLRVGHLHWLSSLPNLQFLDMSYVDFSHVSDSMHALNNLPSLLELRLQQCQLGNTHLSHASFFNSSWHSTIQHLDLSHNNLDGSAVKFFANMTTLVSLDLSNNQLSSPLPLWLQNMENLESLNLASNSFSHVEGGFVIGIVGKLCKLKELDLSYNQLEGDILGFPKNLTGLCNSFDLESLDLSSNSITSTLLHWLWNRFKNLKHLYLSENRLFGQIPVPIASLSTLEVLDLSGNNFNGTIPSSLGWLPSLTELSLGHNFLNGSIPSFHPMLCSLKKLDLSNNRLSGYISKSLEHCNNITYIGLSANFLQGLMLSKQFSNLSDLKVLDLSDNSLTLNFDSDWKPPFQLHWLSLSSNKIKGKLPQWINTQKQLKYLDLSRCEILGNMPTWLWHKDLVFLNLSYNHITGPVTHFRHRISTIDLSHNLLSGPIPQNNPINSSLTLYSLCHLKYLSFLSLQNNSLSGTIPNCWHNSEGLTVINLSSNKLSGPIPTTLKSCKNLVILDLGENMLSGEIPSFGKHSHPYLQILRLRANELDGVIPHQLCSLPSLQILDFAINNLSGKIPHCLSQLNSMKLVDTIPDVDVIGPVSSTPNSQGQLQQPIYFGGENVVEVIKGQELEYTKTLYLLENLDLSCNGLVGVIPEEVTSLSGLISLNLSQNHLTGRIPRNISQMRSLESLDLSNNNLSGTIPTSIGELPYLSHLNLSYNKFHGQIPTGNQLQVIDNPLYVYIGNSELCGDPLPNKCFNPYNQQQQEQEHDENDEDERENGLFYMVIMLGVASGFWGVVGVVIFMESWRYALFKFVEDCMDYLVAKKRINRLKN